MGALSPHLDLNSYGKECCISGQLATSELQVLALSAGRKE